MESDEGESDIEVPGNRDAAGDMPLPAAPVGTDATPDVLENVTKNMSQRYMTNSIVTTRIDCTNCAGVIVTY